MNHHMLTGLKARGRAAVFATVAALVLAASPAMAGGSLDVPGPLDLTIQEAIDIAPSLGADEIIVAPGTYNENINLNGLEVWLHSSGGPEVTIIDGGAAGPVVTCDSEETPTTIIEGFTLRNGLANGSPPNERGGGLYCDATSPTVINCVFFDNEAVIGGAFYNNTGTIDFTDCVFNQNHATGTGGAVYQNAGTVNYTDCVFSGNTADSHAGAIRHVSAFGTYTRCTFENNQSGANGGALDMAGSTSNMTYRDCLFLDNTSVGVGGAVQLATPTTSTITWINCVFDGNDATGNGGAIHVLGRGEFFNCTFYDNSTAGGGGGGAIYTTGGAPAALAMNCIAWGNAPNGFNGETTATYCNIQNVLAGVGNISLDPLFVDAASGDLRLHDTSPCLDAGDSTLLPLSVATDFDLLPRAMNALNGGETGVPALGYYVDMGAYEFQPAGGPDPCPADTNGDGLIDVVDLLNVLGAWGSCF